MAEGGKAGKQHCLLFLRRTIWFSHSQAVLPFKLTNLGETRCLCETRMPPQRPLFFLNVTLIFDLDLSSKKGLTKWNTHVRYEGCITITIH